MEIRAPLGWFWPCPVLSEAADTARSWTEPRGGRCAAGCREVSEEVVLGERELLEGLGVLRQNTEKLDSLSAVALDSRQKFSKIHCAKLS